MPPRSQRRDDPMERKKEGFISLCLAGILLLSVGWLSGIASSPTFHARSIAALDEKKVTLVELTAATAAASAAISAVPGDATTPIANEIMDLSSYLLLAVGAILLEKFLLTLTGSLTFTVLIPAACLLGILYQFLPRPFLKRLAIRLAVFGVMICLVVPVSLQVGTLVEETFEVQKTLEEAERSAGELKGTPDQQETADGSSSNWLSQIGQHIANGVSGAVSAMETALSNFIDAVAVLLIVNCVLPLLVLLVFLWITKAVFTLSDSRISDTHPRH